MDGEYFLITGSNGRKYRVHALDAQHAQHVEQEINAAIAAKDPDLRTLRQNKGYTITLPRAPVHAAAPRGHSDITSLVGQGGAFGLGDELSGVMGMLYTAAKAPFSSKVSLSDVPKAYTQWRDRQEADYEATRREHPNLAPIAETAGSLVSLPSRAVAAGSGLFASAGGARNLWQATKSGAKAGAVAGAVSGFGYGRGADSSLGGAALGAGTGATLGALAPPAIDLVGKTVGTAARFVRPDNGVGRQLVLKAMRDDGIVPSQAGQVIAGAQSRGVPAMIADLGDNLRGLTGSVSRRPGAARTMARNAITERQAGQTERVRGHIVRDLGPVTNVAEQSDRLIQQGRTAAAPLYNNVYAQPGRDSEELHSLLQTPAGKAALSKARTIAANEREDPTKLGFGLDENGETILTKNFSPKTLDYVKRGLDDVLEPFRNPVTGKLNLGEAGRAMDGVRKSFVKEVDQLHPGYADARAAYAGPARENQALLQGRQSINAAPEELQQMMARMSPSEREQFALGHRVAMAEAIDKKVDGADKVNALLGTPQKRKALAEVHSGANYDQFLQSMADEKMGNETYRTVATGSPTAERQAFDGSTDDQALLQDLAGRAIKGATNGGGLTGAVAEGINAFRDMGRFGAGKAGERAREDAASLLTETDPEALRRAVHEAMRQDLLSRMHQRGVYRKQANVGLFGGRAAGGLSGWALQPPEDAGY